MSPLKYIQDSTPYACNQQPHRIENNASLKHGISLSEFVDLLPRTIRGVSREEIPDADPIAELLGSLDLQRSELELERFCFIEPSKKYTRNLIATDNETYTLLLMCWNPGKFSPVHNHPCDGCWMRVVKGSIREVRYEKEEGTNSLSCTSDNTFVESEHTFIDDNQGYHKIGNPNENQMAMTIHLYCPPFKQCKVWMDLCQASNPSTICLSNFSEYGSEV